MAQVNPLEQMMMRIPKGTKMCPANRAQSVAGANPEYYIVLDEDTDATVQSGFKFLLEGSNVVRFQQNENIEELFTKLANNQVALQQVNIQAGIRYYVSDEKRDPIGLPRRLECSSDFILMPGSKIILNANVTVLTYTTRKRLQTGEAHDVFV